MGDIQLFVSHAHKDADVASALVDIIEAAMDVPRRAILCTSAPGYGLPLGSDVSEHLRQHLTQASCVIAVLTTYSLSSKWCMFELGGAWSRATHTYPMLARGLTPNDLPAALKGTLGGQIGEPRDIRNLLIDVRRRLGWQERNMAAAEDKIQRLAEMLKNSKISSDDVDEELGADFVAKLNFIGDRQQSLLNYIVRNGRGKDCIPFSELQKAFSVEGGSLHYRLMQLRYLRFLSRHELGQAADRRPEYGWSLSPEYAEKVWT